MIIYEVRLEIEAESFEAYLVWLREHVKRMLKYPGFTKARFLIPQQEERQNSKSAVYVQYELTDQQSLDSYFDQYAAAMREDGLKKFPGKFTATRCCFEIMEAFFPD